MKLLINLSVPAVSGHYDLLIPNSLRIQEIIWLISEVVEELSDYLYAPTGDEVLCLKERNLILKRDRTFEDYGVKNGEHIILL